MINRASILSLIAILSVFLFGESFSIEKIELLRTPHTSQLTEISIVDADIPNPSSLLSGQESSRTVSSSRRLVQRTTYRRTYTANLALKVDSKSSVTELNHNTYKPNVLGGIVADRAFYSLCCLRI